MTDEVLIIVKYLLIITRATHCVPTISDIDIISGLGNKHTRRRRRSRVIPKERIVLKDHFTIIHCQ